MPMNRYEIRDEYSLADPELYRAADKDDPEALLEGVAMAGMVGVLRQLGDLAEFAAEIFHDLHEEVMATAVRGHNLMIRVQQLEAEVPSVEKALLSQTDLSSVFYNAGVDWHANLRLEQNLVTQGDLPRFVMDSYEECRGPPRLFLLDKFDVAGAGACLKRYTDPSFFKVETSATANVNVQREKKIRKAKKKGPRARYGETPERLQASSHAKLHQLLLEECVENGDTKTAYRARLKRRPNAFPFNSKSGKSYMEELLKHPSPEHKMLHEIIVSSPLQMSIDDQNDSVLELRSVSPARESEGSKSNPPFSEREEIMANPSFNQTNDASADIKTYGVSSLLNILTDDIRSTSDEEISGKDITIDGESKMEGSLIGYQSDEVASEIDNYVDAPSTMESEMDTDSELRVKDNFTSYNKNQPLASVKNQEHCHSRSLDSQSTGDLSISDEGNNSYKKEMSSFLSSDSPRTSAENPQAEKLSVDGFPSADIPEFVIVNASSVERSPQHFPRYDVLKPVVSNDTFPGNDSFPENRPDFEQPTSSSCCANLGPTLPHYDSRAVALEGSLRGDKSDETVSNSDDSEKRQDLILDSQCSPSASSKSLEDDSQRSSSGEHLFDGKIPRVSPCADTSYHTSDSLAAVSDCLVHEDDYDLKDLNQFESIPSTVNMDNVIYQNRIDTEEIVSNKNPIPAKLNNGVAKLTDNSANDYADLAHDGDNVASEVYERDESNQSNHFYNEVPNVVSETLDSEDHSFDQINTGTLILSGIGHPPVFLEGGLVPHDKDATPEGPTTIDGTSEVGNLKTSEVIGLQIEITDVVNPSDLTAKDNSFCMPETLEDSSGVSCTAEKDGVNPDSGIGGLQVSEISSSETLRLPSQMPESLDELDPSTDQSENARMACSIPAVSNNTILENVISPAGIDILVEEHVPSFQDLVEEDDATGLSGFNRESEVEEEERRDLSGSHSESGLVKEVDGEAAGLDFAAVCRMKHDDHSEPEVSHTDFSSHLDSEVKHRVDMVNASQILTPLEQSGLDTEDESFHQSGVENLVSDVDSLHISSVAEESIFPENIDLRSAPIDDALPDSSEIISSELSSVFPTSQLQMLDHDNDNGFDSSASLFPPPVSMLPGLGDYGTDTSAYPKGPSGFMFSPGNFPPEINQMNRHQSPSLPPLPPLQWRIGKLQHASSTTEVDKMEIKQVFPEASLPPETSTGNVSSVPEHTKQSPTQSPQITIKEENHERGCPSLKANAMHEPISIPQKIEIEQDQEQPQQQLLNPTTESEVSSPAEEVEVAEGSKMVKLPVQIVPQSTVKEEHTEHCPPTSEADSMDQAVHPPPEEEKEQQKQQLHLVFPMQECIVPSPAVEDGVANGHRTIKLPRTCNPVIGSVAALDKSRLRKVTEQVRPQKQKQDERDALLDQIRAKSFNLKPTATTRPSIQGPNTNLKMAAILEKANAIRQALAGSDEDDDDNWSDS